MNGNGWTDEEIEKLKRDWTKKGSSCSGDFERHTPVDVRDKAKGLGLKTGSFFWSAEDDQYVKDHYGKMTAREMAAVLGRTVQSVASRTKSLGLSKVKRSYNYWDAEQDDFLDHAVTAMCDADIAYVLGRSVKSVELRRFKKGIKLDGFDHSRDDGWSREEIKILYDDHKTCSDEDLAALTGHAEDDVREKCLSLGLARKKDDSGAVSGGRDMAFVGTGRHASHVRHRWTEEMIDFIREHYTDMTDAEMAEKLGVTELALRDRRYYLNIGVRGERKTG